jgi:hypothetical protein
MIQCGEWWSDPTTEVDPLGQAVNWSNVSHNLAIGEDEEGARSDPRPKNYMAGFSSAQPAGTWRVFLAA